MYKAIAEENCGLCHGTGTWFFAIGENDYGKDICECVQLVRVSFITIHE